MPDRPRWEQMWSTFGVVAGLDSEQQEKYLKQMDDVDLRSEVEKLIAVKQDPDALLKTPMFGSVPESSDGPRLLIGTQIDRYIITDLIGEGGMGVVYSAWQGDPLNRKVALKLIKAGMDSHEVLRRFSSERTLMASMQHANVAQIHDAGSTDQGRAYLVMEYVDGLPINAFCRQYKLSAEQRIHVFLQVCHGLEHAHQKGIIHRDIKPGNVLVSGTGTHFQAKIIDFGIAKVLATDHKNQDANTVQGTPIGTPQYMSPEQAVIDGSGVDTRSDIYSLGVLLYRLLSGKHPLDIDKIQDRSGRELKQFLLETPPLAPSVRLNQGDLDQNFLDEIGRNNRTLTNYLQGDLDWIIQKAISPERDNRYASVSEFRHDLNRYLNKESVLAAPPSRIYRMNKFIQRNRFAVLAVSAVILTLVLGIIGTTKMAILAKSQQSLAESARNEAVENAEQSRKMLDFLGGLMSNSDPWVSDLGNANQGPITVSMLIDGAAASLDEFNDEPYILEELRSILINTYIGLSEYKKALELYQLSYAEKGLPEVTDERQLSQQRHYIPLHMRAGDYQQAEVLSIRLLAAGERILGRSHNKTIQIQRGYGNNLILQGRNAEALEVLEDNLDRALSISQSSSETLQARQLMGYIHSVASRWDDAHAMNSAALNDSISLNGENHIQSLRLMASQADTLYRKGDLNHASKIYVDVINRIGKHLGREHDQLYRSMSNHGLILNALGHYQDAALLLEQVVEKRHTTYGANHVNTLNSKSNLAISYQGLQRHQDALELRQFIYAERVQAQGQNHPRTLLSLAELGQSDLYLQRPSDAEEKLRAAWAGLLEVNGDKHHWTLNTAVDLARALLQQEKYDSAITHFQLIRPQVTLAYPDNHRIHHQLAAYYGRALSATHQFDQAETLLVSAHAGLLEKFGADDHRTVLANEYLLNHREAVKEHHQ